MELSSAQKLIIAMLADIQAAMKIDGNVDGKFISEAIRTGNEWAIGWEYEFIDDQSESPDHVTHVADVLDMWSVLVNSYNDLPAGEKARVDGATLFGKPAFPGFDGNTESKYASAYRFLIKQMHRYDEYADRISLNSHAPTVDISERMLEVFEPINRAACMRPTGLTGDEIIAVMRARVHPSNR